MGKDDVHIVADAIDKSMMAYDRNGTPLWERRLSVLLEGQHDNWKVRSGDTPPGTYKFGTLYHQSVNQPELFWPYGPVCIDLIDLEGQETGYGRAGVSIHGGGSSLADPGAPWQPLVPTEGCARTHNHIMSNILAPMHAEAKRKNATIYFTVTGRK